MTQSASARGAEIGAWPLIAYSLPAIPFAILTLPMYVVAPSYYAATLGLPIAAVGQAFFVIRVLDALVDPAIGWLADRTRPRFGRRRAWLVAATPFVVVAVWMLFQPPAAAGIAYLIGWGMAMSVAWTAALVPHAAWGVELSTSYAGRARVSAYRESATVVGTLIALLAVPIAPALLGPSGVLTFFTIAIAILLPLTVLIAVSVTAEPAARASARTGAAWAAWREVAENAPFRRLVLAFLLNGFANGIPATLFFFYAEHVLRRADLAGPFLILYLLCGVAGAPVWFALARRWSKHRAWAAGMLLACAVFPIAAMLRADAVLIFALICVATGFTLGADVALPASIQADVIDVDTAKSGEQRSALYVSLWAFATKLALGLAVGAAFPALGAFGFDPGGAGVTDRGIAALAFLYAGAPVMLKLVAVALVWNFPLGMEEHARLRAEIEAR